MQMVNGELLELCRVQCVWPYEVPLVRRAPFLCVSQSPPECRRACTGLEPVLNSFSVPLSSPPHLTPNYCMLVSLAMFSLPLPQVKFYQTRRVFFYDLFTFMVTVIIHNKAFKLSAGLSATFSSPNCSEQYLSPWSLIQLVELPKHSKSQLCYSPSVWPWPSHFLYLIFSFLICKIWGLSAGLSEIKMVKNLEYLLTQ